MRRYPALDHGAMSHRPSRRCSDPFFVARQQDPENMRRWIAQTYVFLAVEQGQILGVGAMNESGEITLNYVSPDARFRGISKALLQRLELQASYLGIRSITLQSSLTALRLYESAGYRRNGPPTKGFGITFGHPLIKNL